METPLTDSAKCLVAGKTWSPHQTNWCIDKSAKKYDMIAFSRHASLKQT